jgi:6-phosphogluconolactonase
MKNRKRLVGSFLGLLVVVAVGGAVVLRCGLRGSTYKYFVYVGNNGESTANIHPHVFDSDSGAIGTRGIAQTAGAAVTSVALLPNNQFLYTAGDNALYGYSLAAADGAMTAVSGNPFVDTGATHVTVSPGSNLLFVTQSANTISSFSINSSTGAPTLVNTVTPLSAAAVSTVVHPSIKTVYVIHNGGTVSQLNYDDSGTLSTTGAPVVTGAAPLYAAVTPNGKFLYVADSGGTTVSGFPLDASTGALGALVSTTVTSGPISLDIDPTSKYLYVATSNGGAGGKLEAYSIDSTSGSLTALAGSPFTSPAAAAPSMVKVEPSGNFVLVAHYRATGTSQMAVYGIAASTGVPTSVGSAYDICSNILAMAVARIIQ